MKTLPLVIFAVAALAQWTVPVMGIWQHEQVLANGTLVKIKCTAPDPYDPLRGRYLAVRPEQQEVTLPDEGNFPSGVPVYGTLTTGSDGLARVTALSAKPPQSGEYIRLKTRWQSDKIVHISWPFDRLYLNEKLAPEADQWFAENIRSAKGIIAEVRVLNGRAVLTELTFDGKSFRQILKERVR